MKRRELIELASSFIAAVGSIGVILGAIGAAVRSWELIAATHGKLPAYLFLMIASVPILAIGIIALKEHTK